MAQVAAPERPATCPTGCCAPPGTQYLASSAQYLRGTALPGLATLPTVLLPHLSPSVPATHDKGIAALPPRYPYFFAFGTRYPLTLPNPSEADPTLNPAASRLFLRRSMLHYFFPFPLSSASPRARTNSTRAGLPCPILACGFKGSQINVVLRRIVLLGINVVLGIHVLLTIHVLLGINISCFCLAHALGRPCAGSPQR